MREWRVGTFTMGLSLIALGVFLFLDFSGVFNGFYWAMRLWPVIVILLGIEVLLYAYVANKKPEGLKIKYDFVSMLMVILIGMASCGVWGFNEVMDRYGNQIGDEVFGGQIKVYHNEQGYNNDINKYININDDGTLDKNY